MHWPKLRLSWPHLIGPLFHFELLCLARSGWFIWLRTLYAIVLLGLFWFKVQNHWPPVVIFANTPRLEGLQRHMGLLVEEFTSSLLITQIVGIMLLAPLYLAPCIVAERNRGTLELLLTTHLHSREIILSKYLARVLVLSGILLTGLPVVVLIHFLGGVNYWLVLGGFAIATITAFQAGSVSIFCSTVGRGPVGCMLATYGILFAEMAFCVVPLSTNPVSALVFLDMRLSSGTAFFSLWPLSANAGPAEITLNLIAEYAFIQAFPTGLFLVMSIIHLRKYRPSQLPEFISPTWQRVEPPPISVPFFAMLLPDGARKKSDGETDLLWRKELLDGNDTILGLYYVIFAFIGVLFGALTLTYLFFSILGAVRYSTGSQDAVLGLFVLLATWTFAGACVIEGLRTANSVSGERERRTLESLLVLPIDRRDLLQIKWLVGLWHLRWAAGFIAVACVLAVLSGVIHPVAGLLFLAAGAIHVLFFTVLGLWLSVSCPTSLRAKLTFGVVAFVLPIGLFLLLPPNEVWQVAFNPVACWISLGFGWTAFEGAVVNLMLYGAATSVLWHSAAWRFESNPLGEKR